MMYDSFCLMFLCCVHFLLESVTVIFDFAGANVQALIDYYQKNTLEKIFPEVKTSLQIPYKDSSKWCCSLFLMLMCY